MHDRELEATADTKSCPSPQAVERQTETPEAQGALSPQHDALARMTSGLGNAATASAHASSLSHATSSQPSRAVRSLRRLQQHYGNRYVQRVLALSRRGEGDGEVAPEVEQAIQRQRGRGWPLDSAVRAQMEPAFGADFSGVRVHTDRLASTTAQQLNAVGFTVGRDIFVSRGQCHLRGQEGKRLLAHELTHVAHQANVGARRPGVAPPNSLAERKANAYAASIASRSGKAPQFESPIDFHDWGPAWQIHAQRVVPRTRGPIAHREERLGLRPGEFGPPVGTVEVRTAEEIEVSPGHIVSNLTALEYRGALTGETFWLQFVWFQMTAVTPAGIARMAGSIPVRGRTLPLPFTTDPAGPRWAVDSSDARNPFYESGYLAIRTSDSTTIFDRPGGSSAAPLARAIFTAGIGATSVTFSAHFSTYLVQTDHARMPRVRNHVVPLVAIYHVPWTATTTFTQPGGLLVTGPVTYAVGLAGNVAGLPADLRTILHSNYPAFRHVR